MGKPICTATWTEMGNRGGCNFCTREKEEMIWVISSKDEHRHLEIRLCDKCMNEIREQTFLRFVPQVNSVFDIAMHTQDTLYELELTGMPIDKEPNG